MPHPFPKQRRPSSAVLPLFSVPARSRLLLRYSSFPVRHPRSSPFKALRVLLVFEQPVELWVQLVALGGGSPVRQFPTDKDASGTERRRVTSSHHVTSSRRRAHPPPPPLSPDVPAGRFDVVVTDRSCPAALEKAVTSQEVPLVSPEWLIQSVIRGERLGFTGKPQYRHDFSSSSSSS